MRFLLFLFPISLCGGLINVPSDYVSILAAVNASSAGEMIVISPGVFSGNENCGIYINKPLILKGAGPGGTVVDCEGTGMRCLEIENVVGQIVIDGIQFSNGISPLLYLPTTTRRGREGSMVRRESRGSMDDDKISKNAALTTTTNDDDWIPIAMLMLTPRGFVLVPNISSKEKKKCCERRRRKEQSRIIKTASKTATATSERVGKKMAERDLMKQERKKMKVRALADVTDAGGCIVAVNVRRLTLSNVWINGGQAGRRGGGMAIIGSQNVMISGCDISNNNILGDSPTVKDKGGAQGGGLMMSDTLQTMVSSTRFSQNSIFVLGASPSYVDVSLGGGMYWKASSSSFSTVVVNASLVTNNSMISFENSTNSNYGYLEGGGLCFQASSRGNNSVLVSNSSIVCNTISGTGSDLQLQGGGLFMSGGKNTLTVSSCSIISNTISGSAFYLQGSGVYMGGSQNIATIYSSFIASNAILGSGYFLQGGGVYMECDTKSTLTVLSSSIISNAISGSGSEYLQGGGAFVLANNDENALTIVRSLVVSNTISGSASVLKGGGVYLQSTNENNALTLSSCFVTSSIISGSGSFLQGSGVYMECDTKSTLTVLSSSIISNAISGSGSYFQGGGMYIESDTTNTLTILSSLFISNTISGSGSALSGAGLCCVASAEKNTLEIALSRFVGNDALDVFAFSFGIMGASNAQSNLEPCSGSTSLISPSGVITDGSGDEKYKDNRKCTWSPRIADRAFRQSNRIFAFEFLSLDLESNENSACFDYIALYDGSSSASPLIGIYCGTMIQPICASGLCPPTNNTIFTSQSDFFVVFSSDNGGNFQGFEIAYTAIEPSSLPAVHYSRTALLRSIDLFDSSNSSIGGGLCIEGAFTASVKDCHFLNNSAQHWLSAAGGGIAILNTKGEIIKLSSVSLLENSAFSDGYVASGGGLASIAGNVECSKNVSMIKNEAYATGSCWNQLDVAGWSCPTSLGGAAVALGGGSIVISSIDSIVDANKARCSISAMAAKAGQPCLSGGGGVASIGQDTQIIISSSKLSNNTAPRGGGIFVTDSAVGRLQRNTTCSNNSADCNLVGNAIGCQTSAGGCGYVDSGELQFSEGAATMRNRANEGGAVFATNDGKVVASNSFFVRNHADVMGGALLAYSRASIAVDGGLFDMNNASRATVVAGMNDDGSSRYLFGGNVSIIGANGSLAIAAGPWSGLDNLTRWQCAHEGSIFRMDASSQSFFSMQCDVCASGSYAVGKAMGVRECLPCPYGGACGQSNSTWNGLRAVGGFWGREVEEEAQFLPCPSGYCCPVGRNCTFNYCGGGREGLLCSRCPNGTGLAYFTTGCVPSETCNDLKWVLPIAFIAAIVMALWLLKTTGRDSSGLIAVLLFFYQISPVVKSTPWQHVAPEAIGVVQAIFQVSAPDVSGEGGDSNNYESSSPSRRGVCIVPEMRASQKLGSRLLFQALVFLAIIVVAAIHFSLHHLLPRHIKRPGSWKALYIPAIVRFLTIAYLTLVLVPLQMIQCVRIDGEQKWWWDAQVKCFESWQVGALAAICILSPIPLLMIWMSKNRILGLMDGGCGEQSSRFVRTVASSSSSLNVDDGRKWLSATDAVLCTGFREERRWWLGVSLYRRLIVVVIYTAIEDSNWRSMAMTCALCVFLMINLIVKPFKNTITHRAETGSLLILCFLSALTSPQLAQSQFGTSEKIYDEKGLEIVQMTLLAIPIVVYVMFQIWQFVRARFVSKDGGDQVDDERELAVAERRHSRGLEEEKRDHRCAICESIKKGDENYGDSIVGILDGLSAEEQEEVLRCEFHQFC